MFCYLYWQMLLLFCYLTFSHFLHLSNEESFLNQISQGLISLFVTRLVPLQLVCLGMNCPSILRRSERSIRFLGRCLAVRLYSRTWSDTPSRSYPQWSGRNSTFLGYQGRGSYFHTLDNVGNHFKIPTLRVW